MLFSTRSLSTFYTLPEPVAELVEALSKGGILEKPGIIAKNGW